MANRYFTQFQWSLEKNPVLLFAKVGQGDTSTVTTVADVSQDLAGSFFRIKGFKVSASGTQYYFWFKVSGTGTDPNNAGETGIEVDIATNATAAAVATAVQAAAAANVNLTLDFTVSRSTNVLTFVSKAGGCANAHDGLSAYATSFAFTNTVYPVLDETNSKGIKSIERTGTGLYTVTMGTPAPTSAVDLYNRIFYTDHRFLLATGTPAAPLMFVVSQEVGSLGTVHLKFTAADGSTATDPACGEELWLEFYLKNSTAQ